MRKSIVAGALCAAAAAVLSAQEKPPVQNPPDKKPEGVLMAPQAPREIIRRSVDLVTNTVVVRDEKGVFVPSLGKNDFEVYEDGVKQDLITFVLRGKRSYQLTCRWRESDGEPAACAQLATSFRFR